MYLNYLTIDSHMKTFQFKAVLLCGFLLTLNVGCVSRSYTDSKDDPYSDLRLSERDVLRLEQSAAQGGERAAFQLSMYYQFVKHDPVKRMTHLKRAAELGSVAAMKYLINAYTNDEKFIDKNSASLYLKMLQEKYEEIGRTNSETIRDYADEIGKMSQP